MGLENDFERLREDLKSQGHVFRTGSDSEVIIHLYQQYGLVRLMDVLTRRRSQARGEIQSESRMR